jgi:TRAP-type C4-dicarboxylate transport system permease small subunit
VAIDVIPTRLSKPAQDRLMLIVRILIILFCILAMVIGGFRLVYITYVLGQNSPALQVPLAVVYSVIPISGLLIIYYKLSDILKKQ